MGCDYYEDSGVAAYFKNGAFIIKNYDRSSIYDFHFEFDKDIEGDFERKEKEWMNNNSTDRVIFTDGGWLIDKQSQINFYVGLVKPTYENPDYTLLTRDCKPIEENYPRDFNKDLVKLVKYTSISIRY